MKKALSLIIAVVLVAAMAFTAYADTTTYYSISIENSETGHTYEAYQIFAGNLSEGVLSNITWGTGVTSDGQTHFGDAATKAAALTTDNAAAFAAEVENYLGTVAGSANAPVSGKYTISGLAPGYYLIKDKDNTLDNKDDSYTSYILQVTSNQTISPKSDVPQLIKKVDDKNDSTTTEDAVVWQDSADYDIGDDVPFKLQATLVNNITSYGTYKIVFHDYMCDGLTFDASSVKVFVGDENTTPVNSSYYTVVTSGLSDGCDFEVVINDVEAMGATNNSLITVTYNSTLNTSANIGALGNDNIAYLTYSNNPNQGVDTDGDGIVDDTEGTGSEEQVDYGKTPEDKVIVFTYKVVINKVKYKSGSSTETEALTGAAFKLEKKDASGNWAEVTGKLTVSGNVFTFTGIDDGDYKLTETTTPNGYNSIDPIEFTVTAEHVVESDNPTLTKLEATGLATNTITGDISTGTITTDILNLAGATLPSTGGIGTTIFYVVGGLLMIVAVVVLVAKKRVGAED